MGINGVSSYVYRGTKKSGNENSQIKVLEQKLQQLNNERSKAAKANDAEKVKKIEEQIKSVKERIEQLKQRENKKQDQTLQKARNNKEASLGNFIDIYA